MLFAFKSTGKGPFLLTVFESRRFFICRGRGRLKLLRSRIVLLRSCFNGDFESSSLSWSFLFFTSWFCWLSLWSRFGSSFIFFRGCCWGCSRSFRLFCIWCGLSLSIWFRFSRWFGILRLLGPFCRLRFLHWFTLCLFGFRSCLLLLSLFLRFGLLFFYWLFLLLLYWLGFLLLHWLVFWRLSSLWLRLDGFFLISLSLCRFRLDRLLHERFLMLLLNFLQLTTSDCFRVRLWPGLFAREIVTKQLFSPLHFFRLIKVRNMRFGLLIILHHSLFCGALLGLVALLVFFLHIIFDHQIGGNNWLLLNGIAVPFDQWCHIFSFDLSKHVSHPMEEIA